MNKKILSLFLILFMTFSAISFTNASSLYETSDITVKHKKLEKSDKNIEMNIYIPETSGFKLSEHLNSKITDDIIKEIGFLNTDLKEVISQGYEVENKYTLDTFYNYTRSDNMLSICLNISDYTGGVHGYTWINSYNINTYENKFYKFEDLFKNPEKGKEIIANRIIVQIRKESDGFDDDAIEKVKNQKDNFNFYIDGNNIIVYFDLYELAPYAFGMPKFVFSAESLKDYLKKDIYNSLIKLKSSEKVMFNGSSIKLKNTVLKSQNSIKVPLRDIAELLRYKIEWDSQNGALLNGIPVENQTQVEIKNDISYVPITYFSDVLKEDVFFDYYNDLLRIYQKNLFNNQYYDEILNFSFPNSSENCADLFANALKNENKFMQLALLNDDVKEDFESIIAQLPKEKISNYDLEKEDIYTNNVILHYTVGEDIQKDIKLIIKTEKNEADGYGYFTIKEILYSSI